MGIEDTHKIEKKIRSVNLRRVSDVIKNTLFTKGERKLISLIES